MAQGIEQQTYLFWIEILGAVSRDVFGQTEHLETLADRLEHNILERPLCVLAKLTRM